MAGSTFFNDSSLQVVSITDFTPGLYQYGNDAVPAVYPGVAPLGSACYAVRCYAKPNIGLVPFFSYAAIAGTLLPSGNSPAGHPWSKFITTGTGCLADVTPESMAPSGRVPISQTVQMSDYLLHCTAGIDSAGNVYSTGTRFWSTNGTTFNGAAALWTNIAQSTPCAVSIGNGAVNATDDAPSSVILIATLGALTGASTNTYYAPGPSTAGAELVGIADMFGWGAFSQNNRVLTIQENPIPLELTPAAYGDQDSTFFWTDPPASTNTAATAINSGFNAVSYLIDDATGFGAWGSVSTGELVLVRRGQGAVIVFGDPAYPSSVTKLPAVRGTGSVGQRMVPCQSGLVYVTDTDGVYAWNGGNTAIKISGQIPDNACLRADLDFDGGFLAAGNAFAGVRVQQDVLNDFVFFANNFVFDATTSSWWLSEDPTVRTFAVHTAAKAGRYMYATPSQGAPGSFLNTYRFDFTGGATTYTWISNPIPIPSTPGTVPTLAEVEISASNTTATPSTITITPMIPPTSTAAFANNAQSVTFTIPANTVGYRGSERLGFTEQAVCVSVAANGEGVAAPVLHELHLGFSTTNTSGVGT